MGYGKEIYNALIPHSDITITHQGTGRIDSVAAADVRGNSWNTSIVKDGYWYIDVGHFSTAITGAVVEIDILGSYDGDHWYDKQKLRYSTSYNDLIYQTAFPNYTSITYRVASCGGISDLKVSLEQHIEY